MIEGVYLDVLFTAASYANWDGTETEIKDELIKDLGFTDAQVDEFFFVNAKMNLMSSTW